MPIAYIKVEVAVCFFWFGFSPTALHSMPKSYSSNSSSGARLDSGLYSNRCFTGSFNSNPSRARSPSPSEYYQQRYIFQDRLEQRLFELNKFVHHAVDRFLDKQTVLDLIRSYDNDDDLCSDLADDQKQSHNDTPVVSDNVLMRASSACSSAARSIVDKISDNLKIVQPVAKRERDINNKAESDYSQHDL